MKEINVPSIEIAECLLKEGENINPGNWVGHSRNTAKAAGFIAAACPGMEEESAYVLGLLHDIGRREGVSKLHHTLNGYKYMMELGYTYSARICLTHSFSVKEVSLFKGRDCTDEEVAFIQSYIDETEYSDYDRLIQLCDLLALPNGLCLIEKRIVDISLRHGVSENSTRKWKAVFTLKNYFESKIGKSIYSLLPGIVETTFGTKDLV